MTDSLDALPVDVTTAPGPSHVNVHHATDGRDILMNTPDGWEIDQPWLWWDGPAGEGGNGEGGPWGNPPPGAEYAAPGLRGVGLPAVSRCLQLTADKLASMPWKVYRGRDRLTTPGWIADPQNLQSDGRRAEVVDLPVRLSSFDFWSTYLRSLLLQGEGIAYTPRVADADGNPTGPIVAPCYVLNPAHLDIRHGHWYVIEPGIDEADWIELDPRELLVTRWIMKPGHKRGLGIIQAHARDLAFGGHARSWADNLLQRGVPNGYLASSKPDLTQAAADNLKTNWMKAHGGDRKSIAVLNATTEFHPISLDPKTMQYVEMRRLSAWDICLMFGVPPTKLGINMGQSNTYANLESENTAYVQDALMPIAARIEATVDAALPVGTEMKVAFDQLMRADTTSRFAAYEVGIRAGFLTVDEVRAYEDLPPLPPTTPAPAAAAAIAAADTGTEV